MSWDDAEMRLENMPDGSFLVRDSSDDRHILSLSFRAQGSTHHTRIEHHNGKCCGITILLYAVWFLTPPSPGPISSCACGRVRHKEKILHSKSAANFNFT